MKKILVTALALVVAIVVGTYAYGVSAASPPGSTVAAVDTSKDIQLDASQEGRIVSALAAAQQANLQLQATQARLDATVNGVRAEAKCPDTEMDLVPKGDGTDANPVHLYWRPKAAPTNGSSTSTGMSTGTGVQLKSPPGAPTARSGTPNEPSSK